MIWCQEYRLRICCRPFWRLWLNQPSVTLAWVMTPLYLSALVRDPTVYILMHYYIIYTSACECVIRPVYVLYVHVHSVSLVSLAVLYNSEPDQRFPVLSEFMRTRALVKEFSILHCVHFLPHVMLYTVDMCRRRVREKSCWGSTQWPPNSWQWSLLQFRVPSSQTRTRFASPPPPSPTELYTLLPFTHSWWCLQWSARQGNCCCLESMKWLSALPTPNPPSSQVHTYIVGRVSMYVLIV